MKFVAFGVCGLLWPFVAFCGLLWPFVAFCGQSRVREFRENEDFFVKFGRDRLIVSNGKTGKCHFVAGEL
jgi:hypothetical protein